MVLARLGVISTLILVMAAAACGDDEPTANSTTNPETPPGSTPPPPPPLQGTPSSDEVNEKFGVFVATTGTADGDGSRAKPLLTIAAGIERAKATSRRVYVCVGTFKEGVTLEPAIPMVGGFDCTQAEWKKGAARTRVESPTSPALTATNINVPTRIEGFEFYAPDGVEATPTSIGFYARSSPALIIASSKIVAGRGKDGAPGTEGIQLVLGAAAQGGDALPEVSPILPHDGSPKNQLRLGPPGGVGACTGAVGYDGESGGSGGAGATLKDSGGAWATHQQTVPPFLIYNATNGESRTGANGQVGGNGASAIAPSAVSASGFTPADGTPGKNGSPGFGGSGSNGVPNIGTSPGVGWYGFAPSGRGGGAGGCPGLAGTAGKGGGGSIGALLIASPLTLDGTEVNAGDGGAGGKGAFGSSATLGGLGATPGGAGGPSGISGSGAGGSSVGIAHSEGAPNLLNGTAAHAGKGGVGVPALTANDAAGYPKTQPASGAGVATDVQPF